MLRNPPVSIQGSNEASTYATGNVPLPRSRSDRWRGWRGIMCRSVLTTTIGFTFNIVLLVYGGRFYDPDRQVTVLYTGDCGTVSLANIVAHVGVNILATLLVSAASNTINYLTAPSRGDLDCLHANGEGAGVGIWDLRNWKLMSPLRKVLFCCAVLSSVPLHLFYNSIFTTTYVPDNWAGFVVPPTFLNETEWDTTFLNNTWPQAVPVLANVRKNATSGTMQRLDVDGCREALHASLVLNCSTILFVSSADSGSTQPSPLMFMRHDSLANVDTWTLQSRSNTSNFSLDHYNWNDLWNKTSKTGKRYPEIVDELSNVQYCLLQPQPEQCTIQLVPQLIAVVVLFNILGVLAGSVLFLQRSFEPIATLGDAISSYLSQKCPYSFSRLLTDIKGGRVSPMKSGPDVESFINRQLTRLSGHPKTIFKSSAQDSQWYPSQTRWHSAVSPARWLWTSLFFTLYWLSGVIGVAVVLAKSGSPLFALSQGLHAPLPPSSSSPSLTINYDNALANIVLANVFQLLLAMNYVFYQNLLARMAIGAEFNRFVIQHTQLRVSNPVGKQGSGYWFSLPHRLALALLGVSALLHFLISEAIFYEQLRPRDAIPAQAGLSENAIIHAVICNPEALLIFELVGLLAPLAAFAFGWLRRFDPSTPLVTGDSRVLAALSTHRPSESGEPEALKPLRWGVIEETPEGGSVGFSSGAVQPLVGGMVYRLQPQGYS